MNGTGGNGKRSGKSVPSQIILALLANFSNISPGMNIGFSAVAIPYLHHLTLNQISWFASIASLATPIGCMASGPIADRFGRRWAIGVVNATTLIGWSILATAYYVTDHQYKILLLGRFMTGLAAGLCGTPAAIYMAEVASSELRSVFTTWVSLFYAIGIFFVYVLGLILQSNWGTICLIAATFPIFGMTFLLLFIPESPPWLVTKRRFDEAQKNLCRLYGTKTCNDEVNAELQGLIKHSKPKDRLQKSTLPRQIVKKVKMLMKRNFLKPYLLVLTFFFFQQFTGIFVIMFYAIDIVKAAKIELDSYITIVIIALVRVVGMVLLSFISKHIGRRPLSLTSGVGITLSMIGLGSYIVAIQNGSITAEKQSSLSFIPVLLLIFYFVISTIGFYPLPFALCSEVYPRNIRGTAAGISTATNFLFNFVIVKLYPTMEAGLSAYGVFYFYGAMGLLGTIFVFFCLPETRGKSLEEIQEFFGNKERQDMVPEKEQQA
ncbi:facilitated trehalose transporter Tret1-like [Euwallacea similis]|uniref:facilitated trehalose transporter Tret1-like n=1 Tax=Euwallacea similis TaxID=1736056 RepID=UPI00344BE79B